MIVINNDTVSGLDPTGWSLEELQEGYAALDRWYAEEVKPRFDLQKKIRDTIIARIHIGSYWQDQDGTVFRTANKQGQWVDFTPHEIQRTRRPGESKGTMSIKDAEAAGFVIPEQPKRPNMEAIAHEIESREYAGIGTPPSDAK